MAVAQTVNGVLKQDMAGHKMGTNVAAFTVANDDGSYRLMVQDLEKNQVLDKSYKDKKSLDSEFTTILEPKQTDANSSGASQRNSLDVDSRTSGGFKGYAAREAKKVLKESYDRVLNGEDVRKVLTERRNSDIETVDSGEHEVYGGDKIVATGDAWVEAFDNSTVYAKGDSGVWAGDSSTVYAEGDSTVFAKGDSTVYAEEGSTVYAHDNSTVDAKGDSTVYRKSKNATVEKLSDTATIIDERR